MSKGRRRVPLIATVISLGVLVVGLIGLGVSLVVYFMTGGQDAYGEVPIPGSATLELPAGEVLISYRATTPMSGSDGAVIPMLPLKITPPTGAEKPTLTDAGRSSTKSGRELTADLYTAHIAQAGVYKIEVGDGGFSYGEPRLLFGYGSPYGSLLWWFGGVTAVGFVALFPTAFWLMSKGDSGGGQSSDSPSDSPPSYGAPYTPNYAPSDQDVRIEQIKTIAALRDTGALTEAEFEAEKRRILGS
ncbi:SHOCT domain-containing protein [Mycobacterium sp. NPDC051198]